MEGEFNMATFGEKLKYWRTNKNFTQKNLAEKIGIAQQTINRWENGTAIPKSRNITQLAIALNIPVTSFWDESLPAVQKEEIKRAVELDTKMKSFAADYDESGIVGESIKQLSNDDPAFRNIIEKSNKRNADTVKSLLQKRIDYISKKADLMKKTLSCSTQEEFNSVNDDLRRLDEELPDYITGWLPYISDKGRSYIADIIDGMLHNPDYTTDECKELLKQTEKKTE